MNTYFGAAMISICALAVGVNSVSAETLDEFSAWKNIADFCETSKSCGQLVKNTTATFEGNEYPAIEISTPGGIETVFQVPDAIERGWALCYRKNYVESSATFYCKLL